MKAESSYFHKLVDGSPEVYFVVFDIYGLNFLILTSIRNNELDLRAIGDKYQDNNNSVLNNAFINARVKQIPGIIEET